ncbi:MULTISPECIES: hypothetical protein [Streptomyces]|nr:MULTISPECIES: hypothetical protein [Streptomyces]
MNEAGRPIASPDEIRRERDGLVEALRPYTEESTAYRRMRLVALARARGL